MIKKAITFICLALMLQACSKSISPMENIDNNDTDCKLIPIERALENLESFVKKVYPDETREGLTKRIKSIDIYRNQGDTRSEESLPQAYVINYDNNKGFAILGATNDVFPIVAVTENGQIDPETLLVEDESGIVNKEFLAAYLKGAINYSRATGTEEDTISADGTRSGDRANVAPLLNHQFEFSQTHSYCHDNNANFAICGCAATALSTIVAYNERPIMHVTTANEVEVLDYSKVDIKDGIGYSFSLYKNGSSESFATIYFNTHDYFSIYNYRHDTNNLDSLISGTPLDDLFEEYPLYATTGKHCFPVSSVYYYRTRSLLQAAMFYRLNGTPGLEATGASANDIIHCLENINYQNVSKRYALSITNNMLNDIEDMLTNGKPAIMGGSSLFGTAHVWVVDGEYNLPVHNIFALHFNWGWGGRCNGYFAPSGSINSGSAVSYDVNDSNFNDINKNYGQFTTIRYDLPSYINTYSNALEVHYYYEYNPLN